MTQCDEGMKSEALAGTGRSTGALLCTMLFLVAIGVATAAAEASAQSAGEKNPAIVTSVTGTDQGGKPADARPDEQRERLKEEIRSEITASVVEDLKKNLREEIRSEVSGTMSEELRNSIQGDVMNELLRELWKINWTMKEKDKRFRFSGDIRVRYEKDRFDQNNTPDYVLPTDLTRLANDKIDQERYKYRVRFGVEAQVNEKVDAVIRLSTGTTSNPVSTNATMGDYMNKDAVMFDQAYIKWQPSKGLSLYGGRMVNPFFSPTELVWDTDLNFEGLAAKTMSTVHDTWNPFLVIGAFPLQQYDFTQHSKALLAGQIGVERKNQKGISTKLGAAYYNFKNISGVRNDPNHPGETDWTAPLFQQKGNSLFDISANQDGSKYGLAGQYKEVNVTGTFDIGFWDPVHIVFLADYVKNIGFKKGDVVQRVAPGTDYDPPIEVEGYQAGMAVGYPTIQESGQWKVYFYYRRLESDAVLDAFTDSDFHLGGTNAKGWIAGTEYGLAKNFWVVLRWMTADEVSGPPLAIDVFQADVNVRF